jgi:hypothetical protein
MNSLASLLLPSKILGGEPKRAPPLLLGIGGAGFSPASTWFPSVDMVGAVYTGYWVSRGAGVKICLDIAVASRDWVKTGFWVSGVRGCLLLRVAMAEIPTKRNSS